MVQEEEEMAIPMTVMMTAIMIMGAMEEEEEIVMTMMTQEGGEIEATLEKERQTETGVKKAHQEGVNPVAESPGE